MPKTENGPVVCELIAASPAWARLEDQIKWHDTKSQQCKRSHARWDAVQSLLIVFRASFNKVLQWLSNTKSKQLDLWLKYRTLTETLEREKRFFLSAIGPYQNMHVSDRICELAIRVEGILEDNHDKWFDSVRHFNQKTNLAQNDDEE
jgi:hypothetical protein